jgi:hypothetical protein
MLRLRLAIALWAAITVAAPTVSASPSTIALRSEPSSSPNPLGGARAHAIRRTGALAIDGRLDEPAWTSAPRQRGFSQRFPKEGGKAELETSFAILYDDAAVYVGVWADDPEPHNIRRLLTRRDVDSPGDAVTVAIDSYHDRRTAYVFQLNAAGVQRDMMLSDDSKEDWTWDAVWTGDVAMTTTGWCAEFRIPLNQLRFPQRDAHEWGFQVMRAVARTKGQAVWSPWPRSGPETVSRFGVVDGIENLKQGRRLELLPYATGGLESIPREDSNGEKGDVDLDGIGNAGLDVKYGLGSAFTLSATINPDFGQIEADPSQVNLSGNELFFQEKRPFFVEGADLFKLSIGPTNNGLESQFYSRRIGATPPDDDASAPVTIYTATKLTGKTRSGWSVGLIDVVTAKDRDSTEEGTPVIAPLTNYAVGRIKRDFRDGKTAVGASATAVHRALGGTGLEGLYHDQAYSAGLQLEHRWGANNAWVANLGTMGSVVHGTPDAIARTQQSNVHLFQRPDAPHLAFDPTRTSLTGFAGGWSVGRLGPTKHWRYGAGGDFKTAGLELNDVGFQRGSDRMITFYSAEYHDEDPGDSLLNYSINGDVYTVSTFEPQLTDLGIETNGNVQLANYWSINFGGGVNKGFIEPNILRGGPAVHTDTEGRFNVFVNTDSRKRVQVGFGGFGSINPATHSSEGGGDLGITVQARSNIDVFVGPSFFRRNGSAQYVDEVQDENLRAHYVFARINQTNVGMTFRMNWTFSPRLSLQGYAQPFVATGRYSQYKDIDNPRAAKFEDRFTRLEGANLGEMDGVLTATNGGTFQFERPDFNFAQLRSNLVVRWEYRPGSTVFAIWSHGQTFEGVDGRFQLGRDLRELRDTRGEDLVMVKANYWIGL